MIAPAQTLLNLSSTPKTLQMSADVRSLRHEATHRLEEANTLMYFSVTRLCERAPLPPQALLWL